MGEVIFAKSSGGSGAGGELVLAARYVDVGSKRVRLRSLQLNANGKSRIDSANAVGIAASAAAPALGIVAMFMKGKQSAVPAGTVADAKTAEDIAFAPDEIATAGVAVSLGDADDRTAGGAGDCATARHPTSFTTEGEITMMSRTLTLAALAS